MTWVVFQAWSKLLFFQCENRSKKFVGVCWTERRMFSFSRVVSRNFGRAASRGLATYKTSTGMVGISVDPNGRVSLINSSSKVLAAVQVTVYDFFYTFHSIDCCLFPIGYEFHRKYQLASLIVNKSNNYMAFSRNQPRKMKMFVFCDQFHLHFSHFLDRLCCF